MSTKLRKILGLIFGILISVGILWLLLSGLDWQSFSKELEKVNYFYLPVLVLLLVLSMWIRAIRWKYLLPGGSELSTIKLFEVVLVGFFATFVLPFRAGEIVRPLVLTRWQSVRFSVGFASIVTERAFDIIALMIYLVICTSELRNAPDFVAKGAQVLGVLSGLIVIAIFACYFKGEFILSYLEKLIGATIGRKWPALGGKVLALFAGLLEGLAAVGNVKDFFLALFWSLVLWLEVAAVYLIGFWAFGEDPAAITGLTVSVIIAFAVAAPSAPGFIGTFQLGCVAAISGIYGFSKEFALAYSLLLHGYQVICAVLMGIIVLKIEGLGFSEMFKRSDS